MNLALPRLNKKLFIVVMTGSLTAVFCQQYFNHIRVIPRGDIAIFFATLAIIWHVCKIIAFLYDLVDKN